jgi:hypothetical protein
VQVNRYGNDLYFNQESFDRLLGWLVVANAVRVASPPEPIEAAPPAKPAGPTEPARTDALTASATVAPKTPAAKKAALAQTEDRLTTAYDAIQRIQKAVAKSEYKVDKLLEAAQA